MEREERELYEDMTKDFLQQVKKNTEHFHKLQNIQAQKDLRERFEPSSDNATDQGQTCTVPCSATSVEELLRALLEINNKLAQALTLGEGDQRASVISSSSGVSSSRDSADVEHPGVSVSDALPHDGQAILMRPNSEYIMERQGAASLTQRRGVSTRVRQRVKEPEESEDTSEVKCDSASSSDD